MTLPRALRAPRRRSYLVAMGAVTRMSLACAAATALLVAVAASPLHAVVTMQLTSATANAPGGGARVCVMMSSGGARVAGTQNDLIWDGNCASLSSKDSCAVAGAHGKQLSKTDTCGDFCFRAILLNLGDVDPMPDGPLYCCDFQSEAEPGGCCDIRMTNAATSDPEGQSLPTRGNGGKICTSGSSDQPGRGFDPGVTGPGSLSNAPSVADAGVPGSAPAPGAAPAAAPPAQVLSGGGVRVGSTPEAVIAPPTMPAAAPPTAAAAPPTVAAAAPAVAPQPVTPPIAPATAAVTAAATPAATPPAADTPTARARPTLAPTRAATKAAAPKAQDAQPQAQAEDSGGWFGCQINPGASVAPVVGLAALAVIGVFVRRRMRSHTQRTRGGYDDDE